MLAFRVLGAISGLSLSSAAIAAIPEKGSYQEAVYCASSLALSASVMGMSKSSESKDLAKKHEVGAETWIGRASERTKKGENAVMSDFDKQFESMTERLLGGDEAAAAAMVEDAKSCAEAIAD